MALSSELMGTVMALLMKPVSVMKLICIFCVKTALLVINTWVELILAGISLNISIFSKAVLWAIALTTLPIRVLTAVQRERKLEAYLRYKEVEVEYLLWGQKELEGRLQKAIKERKLMEMLLTELEEEHKQTIDRLELLEGELQDLKAENLRFRETQGKDLWNFKSQRSQLKPQSSNYGEIPSSKIPHEGLQEILDTEKKNVDALLGILKDPNLDISDESMAGLKLESSDQFLDEQREVALKRSVFSAILSFLVGMIVWEAKDPCMPLVMALFIVVGMSLNSVVQFFSTIRNKPASDAVALLSLNWFILGTLTYPALPKVARMLTPVVVSLLDRTVRWFGT